MCLFFVIVIDYSSVPPKQSFSATVIKMEDNHYLLLFVVVNGHFFHLDFPVSPELCTIAAAISKYDETAL